MTVAGTLGYEKAIDSFIKNSLALDFAEINQDFLPFLPSIPSRVLDIGAGVGQNSAALANLGYDVVATEPLEVFRQLAKEHYLGIKVNWLNDSLPKLENVSVDLVPFSFVLLDGVWHHLDYQERRESIRKLSEIMLKDGILAVSLRNGPAGAGKHVFPTTNEELIGYGNEYGFEVRLNMTNQPSKMPNKEHVIWSRVVLQKL
ncbi:class I SAM-dependent methyltransferase [Endozoicomonas sp. G2_1]|uniref:class I SAM-dependent methyltransferase n=1 Tax=Endozoicomonas sp. G2_1 TaxID=2821091 RepID=UPI001ADC76FF|nr:class I SAM-dependent methyltransferase [Endozoicomonas sp. G2_1]MBO9492144.1 class I SAM-dependent methyltransferase [Endozoicomonas sp. G2_1]